MRFIGLSTRYLFTVCIPLVIISLSITLIRAELTKYMNRLEELREKAIARYLDKTDWDISEWLDEEERTEYTKLSKELE